MKEICVFINWLKQKLDISKKIKNLNIILVSITI